MSILIAYFYIFTSSLWLLINKSDYFIIMNIVTISGIKSGAVTALMRAPKDQEPVSYTHLTLPTKLEV